VTSPTVLVFHPEPKQARAYVDLVRLPKRGMTVGAASTAEEAAEIIGETEVLYGWKVPPTIYSRAPKLRWVQVMGAGIERFLVPELPPRVQMTRIGGVFGPWMAEYTVGWCLWVTQRIDLFKRLQQERRWDPVDTLRLAGTTLTIVGLGEIGGDIARSARRLGMRTIGVTRGGKPLREAERIYRPRDVKAALAPADFVVLTVPLLAETRGMIGEAELAAMKPSAWLINIARGPVVDEKALIAALRARTIAGAVLDVFNEEPLPADHPFWTLDNVAITPHIAGPSMAAEITPIFNENLRRYAKGLPLRFLVNRKRGY
jgi:phosphoglycerate dehydrogenase-like enzyme